MTFAWHQPIRLHGENSCITFQLDLTQKQKRPLLEYRVNLERNVLFRHDDSPPIYDFTAVAELTPADKWQLIDQNDHLWDAPPGSARARANPIKNSFLWHFSTALPQKGRAWRKSRQKAAKPACLQTAQNDAKKASKFASTYKKIGETHTQRCINVGRKTFPFAVVKCTLFSFGATGSDDLSLTRCIVVGRVPKKSGCPKNFVALFGPPWMGRVFFFFVYWCECVFDLGQLRWCCERRRDDDQQSWPTEKCNAIPLVPPSFSALFGPSTVSVCLWGFGLLFIHFFHISAHSNKSVAGGELVFCTYFDLAHKKSASFCQCVCVHYNQKLIGPAFCV